MLTVRNVKLPLNAALLEGEHLIKLAVASKLKVPVGKILSVRLLKRSVDARKKSDVHFIATLLADLGSEERYVLAQGPDTDVSAYEHPAQLQIPTLAHVPKIRPVVAGFGPAGLFAALYLARAGACPVVVERGSAVEKRARAVRDFIATGSLDACTNVQFGEGGAGTFSDGKLNTNTHNPLVRQVLETFVAAGAPEEILWQAKPHIGTDLLPDAVKALREEIISLGGEVFFETRLVGFEHESGRVTAALVEDVNGTRDLPTDTIVLAAGHSARDTFEMLHASGIALEQKAFSVGVRVEHLQRAIDVSQYGSAAKHPALGAADYKLSCHLASGRGVYTFCMCPGGEVIPSASEPGGVVTNGMSRFARNGINANAAFLVSVSPSDFESTHPLAGIEFQRKLEQAAFQVGGGAYKAPAQLMGDFLARRATREDAGQNNPVHPTYGRGVLWGSVEDCLPAFVVEALREAAPILDRKLRGFASAEAVLTGVETRSSSPVRIVRGDDFQANIAGLYPCGEGAGYAGGIMSSAVDGLRVAAAVAGSYSFL